MKFVVGANSPEEAVELRQRLDSLRKSGELSKIIAGMRLE
jgi:hypothetical protein